MEVLKGGNAPLHMVLTSPYFKADGTSIRGHQHNYKKKRPVIVPDGYVQLKEIYKNTRMDYRQLQNYCINGQIESQKLGGKWYTLESSAISYLKGIKTWVV